MSDLIKGVPVPASLVGPTDDDHRVALPVEQSDPVSLSLFQGTLQPLMGHDYLATQARDCDRHFHKVPGLDQGIDLRLLLIPVFP